MTTSPEPDRTYNGWANYPTWAVNLWLSNDEGLHSQACESVEQILAGPHPTSPYWTQDESQRYATADMLKTWVDELTDDDLSCEGFGMGADLMGWALEQVEWNEIAVAYIQTVNEYAEASA